MSKKIQNNSDSCSKIILEIMSQLCIFILQYLAWYFFYFIYVKDFLYFTVAIVFICCLPVFALRRKILANIFTFL